MAAKICVLKLMLSSSSYMRSAKAQFPFACCIPGMAFSKSIQLKNTKIFELTMSSSIFIL